MRLGLEVVALHCDLRCVIEPALVVKAVGREAITLWDHIICPIGTGDLKGA